MGKVDLQCAERSPRWQHSTNWPDGQKPSFQPGVPIMVMAGRSTGHPQVLQAGQPLRQCLQRGREPKFQGKEKTLPEKNS